MNILAVKSLLPPNIFAELPEILSKFQINTPLRLAHFLGQASYESAHFTKFEENLNYSAIGLLATFPTHFTKESSNLYARQPIKIANHIYQNRGGNRDENSGDGWKFRGRGAFQITLMNNYKEFGKYVSEDIVVNPDLVKSKFALMSAAWFWNTHNLNHVADTGGVNACTAITRVINGGANGLMARIAEFNKFYHLLNT